MNPYWEKIREAFERLTPKQKIQLGLAVVAMLALVWGFTSYVNRVRYGVLFSKLDRQDAATVMTALKEQGVPYRLAAGGTIIEVPFEKVDEVRLDLASEGLPAGGGAGFELFDKPAFGLSDFVQNVNYRRALERELARTIQSLDVVETARVHLALPAESVFADEKREPSASVVVRLRSGRSISSDRVRAISHLVASGVEGIEPGFVSVIDSEGRLISNGDEESSSLSANQLEAKRERERGIESNLISILEPLVGTGKARVRASVEFNMTRIERIQESYDPNGAVVRSEQKSKSKQEGGGRGAGGVPGTASNLPGTPGATPAASDKQETQSSTTNFEINKTTSTISEPVGMLARQSVAVVIDHAAPAAPADGADEGDADTPAQPIPRTAEEMQKITEIVQAAIGFDVNRGDQLNVQNIPFDETATTVETGSGVSIWDQVTRILRFASLPLAVLLLAVLIIRPAIAAVRGLNPSETALAADGPPTIAQLQAQMQSDLASGELLGEKSSPLRRKLIEGVTEDPQAAALVVRSWLDAKGGKR